MRQLRVLIAALALTPIVLISQNASTLSVEQKEAFLKEARIQDRETVKKGVTGTVRVTLSGSTLTHDASVQSIDEFKPLFQPREGKAVRNFKDTYKFNLAAYGLAKMLGIGDMIPATVQRNYAGNRASFTWWIDDVLMEEGDRILKRAAAPDGQAWAREMAIVRVFDQLIANDDRNGGNLIIDKSWRVWMIDHTRSFRERKDVMAPTLTAIDRSMLEKLKLLDEKSLKTDLGDYLTTPEIRALLARRDLVVAAFTNRDPSAFFDRPPR